MVTGRPVTRESVTPGAEAADVVVVLVMDGETVQGLVLRTV